MGTWKSKNRHKYLLQYHIIFVCKYRKKLLVSQQVSDDIKQFSYEICQKHKVIIKYMETDKDHIGLVIGTDGTNVYTVEGNSGDAVKVKSYPINSSVIYGYGLMNY